MNFTDSHIHLKAVPISRKISKAVLVSIDESEWHRILDTAFKHPLQLIPAFGIHPWSASSVCNREYLSRLSDLLHSVPSALVGEIGLDSTERFLNRFAIQEEIFYEQFKLAVELKRAISMHLVGGIAISSLLRYLKRYPLHRPSSLSLHSFTGSLTQLRQIRSNFGTNTKLFLGISQKISGRLPLEKLDRLILEMPNNRLLVESDEEDPGKDVLPTLSWVVEIISRCKNLDTTHALNLLENNFIEFASQG